MLSRFRRVFRVFGVRPDPARELDEEIEAHLEMTEARLRSEGWPPADAREEALRQFGDVERHRRDMMRLDTQRWRMTTMWNTIGTLSHMFHAARRSMARSPAFTVAVAATLGLGLGANAVMFGVVDRLLLSPPQHVVDADNVRRIYERRSLLTADGAVVEPEFSRWLSYGDFEDLKSVDGLAAAAAYTGAGDVVLGSGQTASKVRAIRASASLFDMLGVRPALGRFFASDEDAQGATHVTVISHEFWTRHFGADPEVLGRSLAIGLDEWRIVGVAPPGFTGVELAPVDVWLPLTTFAYANGSAGCLESRNCWWVFAAVRLRDGTSESVAMDQATALHLAARADLIAEGRFDAEAALIAAPLTQGSGPVPTAQASVSQWLAGVSLVVLLIACANVANLLLARGVRLRRELAVRVALGASRGRLLGDLLMESMLLAGLGAATALAIAHFGSDIVHGALIPDVAFVDTGLGRRLGFFLLIVTALTAVVAGAAPALQASRATGSAAPSGARGGTRRRSRVRVGLLVTQAALSTVLLVGAGLFVRSLGAASDLDLGYDAERVVFAQVVWNGVQPTDERAEVYRRTLDRLRGLPGVAEAATTYTVPFESSVSLGQPRVPGVEEYPRNEAGGPYVNKVGAGYFEALGIGIVQGRGFGPADDIVGASPVTVVTATMARDLWPAGGAIGQCLYLGDESPCTEVIGVVEDHRRENLVESVPHHLYYLNLDHPDFRGPPQGLMIRAADGVDARLLAGEVRSAMISVSPTIRFVRSQVLFDNVDPQLRSWRLGAWMFSLFGVLAIVVAAIGLYSVLAFDVAERRREMGVRSALGASQHSLLAMVVRSAVGMVGAGQIVGLLIALVAARFMQPLLFQVSATDPPVYLTVAAVLTSVGVVAALLPGYRATRVGPAEALRAE